MPFAQSTTSFICAASGNDVVPFGTNEKKSHPIGWLLCLCYATKTEDKNVFC